MGHRTHWPLAAIGVVWFGFLACGGRANIGPHSQGAGGADANAGGASGAPGSSASGGSAACGPIVKFRLLAWHPDGGKPVDYCAVCGRVDSIRAPGGEAVELKNWCEVDCTTCQLALCPLIIACPPVYLPLEGAEYSWDGSYFVPGTCGADAQCAKLQCAAVGSHWVATLCALPSTGQNSAGECVSTGPRQCVDVGFDYPTADPVVATLYPTR